MLEKEYAALGELAAAGREYTENLRRETVKMMLLAQPELDPDVTAHVAAGMDTAQLKEFARAFGKLAAK
ncbi:MAG: hypothetical protein LBV27_03785, partial [Oscillospiraceae bacterium]|nr:hypothetical protein [Oscillospiraceae bacterium]